MPHGNQVLRKSLRRLAKSGAAIIIIRDNPRARANFDQCLMNETLPERCNRDRSEAVPTGLDIAAVRSLRESVDIFDFTDEICVPRVCPVMKGARVIYQDSHHLTATFTRTLTAHFERALGRDDAR